ncbi:polymer-forming cytoskeletal protein [Limibacillus sp. MBR-115]|jgi:cytoskeletal protein CcmA (bactofilin family)|uniref:bactofilin family protein n=1 Tax=Limibacillus sp. MBR-115 TaxID=3156465 RepID=UPI003395B03A
MTPSPEPKDNGLGSRPRASIGGVPSIISNDLTIRGNLESDGDIQIDGQVDGDVLSRSVTIGHGARVKGVIRAEEVKVSGQVDGEIHATNVALLASAKVTGDIMHKSLSIDAGAFIEGMLKRIEDARPASMQPKTTAASSGTSAASANSSGSNTSSSPV